MENKSLVEKLKKFKKYVKEFVDENKSGIEDVHKLRVNSREIYSLMGHDDPFYKKIRKVIKLSNKVRDLDVFFEAYLASLPKKLIDELDIKSIVESTNRKREKDIDKLHLYLKYLSIPKSLESKYEEKEFDFDKIDELEYNQKELHKYRIFIKRKLFRVKNILPLEKEKIKLLSTIKDILGTMNDNNNGLKRVESFNIKPALFKKIYDFTLKQNNKLFEEFKIINQKYMEMLI